MVHEQLSDATADQNVGSCPAVSSVAWNLGAWQLRFFTLGCGNAFGSRLATTSFLAVSGDCICLIDCPYKLQNILQDFSRKTGFPITPDQITHVIVTHNHWDHIAGLEMFLRMRMVFAREGDPKPVIVTTRAIYDDLWNHTLKGSLQYFMDAQGNLSMLTDRDHMDFMEVEPGKPITLGGMTLQVRSNAIHPGPTIGVRLTDAQCDIGYSGDGVYDPEMTEHLYDSGIISDEEREDSLNFLWDSALIFHEVGTDSEAVHTRLPTLLKLPATVREKIRLVNLADDFHTDELRLAEQFTEYTSEACLP